MCCCTHVLARGPCAGQRTCFDGSSSELLLRQCFPRQEGQRDSSNSNSPIISGSHAHVRYARAHTHAGPIPEEAPLEADEEVSTLPSFANAENKALDAAVRVRVWGLNACTHARACVCACTCRVVR